MIVFKTFLKVLNKCKFIIILYTILLLFFGVFNMQNNENSTSFVADKPDILVINHDQEEGITKSLVQYLKKNSYVKEDILIEEQNMKDALFYREVNYIIEIPQDYRENFLKGEEPNIQVKSTGDYEASLAEMLLTKYLKVATSYQKEIHSEERLIQKIEETLEKETEVEMTSKLDTDHLSKATFYYNFANYSILAGCVYVICLLLATFQEEKIRKRTMISCMKEGDYQMKLLLSNGIFAFVLWALYVILSIFLIGKTMLTLHGMCYILNSFVFTICAVTIAFLIGNLVKNKNAINGIVNVVALGSSFLCGAFVPMEWLPDFVLKIAHILPSYYYIKNNELLKTLEDFQIETMQPIIFNWIGLLVFTIGLIVITCLLAKKKRRIG